MAQTSLSSPCIEVALNWHRLTRDFLDQFRRIAELTKHNNPVQARKAFDRPSSVYSAPMLPAASVENGSGGTNSRNTSRSRKGITCH